MKMNEEQSHFVDAVVRARRVMQISLSVSEQKLSKHLADSSSDARDDRLRKHGEHTLYHQTDAESAQRILDTGRMFRGFAGALGGGIYFAATPDDTKRKARRQGAILECSVRLGRIKEVTACDTTLTFTKLQRERFDSVLYQGFSSGPEYVVYNFDQVRPLGIHGKPRKLAPKPILLWGPPGTGKTTTLQACALRTFCFVMPLVIFMLFVLHKGQEKFSCNVRPGLY